MSGDTKPQKRPPFLLKRNSSTSSRGSSSSRPSSSGSIKSSIKKLKNSNLLKTIRSKKNSSKTSLTRPDSQSSSLTTQKGEHMYSLHNDTQTSVASTTGDSEIETENKNDVETTRNGEDPILTATTDDSELKGDMNAGTTLRNVSLECVDAETLINSPEDTGSLLVRETAHLLSSSKSAIKNKVYGATDTADGDGGLTEHAPVSPVREPAADPLIDSGTGPSNDTISERGSSMRMRRFYNYIFAAVFLLLIASLLLVTMGAFYH